MTTADDMQHYLDTYGFPPPEKMREWIEVVRGMEVKLDEGQRATNARLHGCAFEGWQCFHCGEIFTTYGGAANHFGEAKGTTPGCVLKVQLGDERGWLMEFRKQEKRIAELEAKVAEETE